MTSRGYRKILKRFTRDFNRGKAMDRTDWEQDMDERRLILSKETRDLDARLTELARMVADQGVGLGEFKDVVQAELDDLKGMSRDQADSIGRLRALVHSERDRLDDLAGCEEDVEPRTIEDIVGRDNVSIIPMLEWLKDRGQAVLDDVDGNWSVTTRHGGEVIHEELRHALVTAVLNVDLWEREDQS